MLSKELHEQAIEFAKKVYDEDGDRLYSMFNQLEEAIIADISGQLFNEFGEDMFTTHQHEDDGLEIVDVVKEQIVRQIYRGLINVN